ncbi:hypothetical protein [Butyrivibrio sp. VCB2006]|uniref:hypothetical protein n=1 Tax=Butyrivibrio sp. VCB2006 TaxID=1280679 RepID=UPI000409663D|nr:hypothetical protein [Butyrivibrio sp. VCB2006]
MRNNTNKLSTKQIISMTVSTVIILVGVAFLLVFLEENFKDPKDIDITNQKSPGIKVVEHSKKMGGTADIDYSELDLTIAVVDQVVYCSDGRIYDNFTKLDKSDFSCIYNSNSTAAIISDDNRSYYIDANLIPVIISDDIHYGGCRFSPDGEKILFESSSEKKFVLFYPNREAYYDIELDEKLDYNTLVNHTVLSPDFETIAFSTKRGTTVFNFETGTILYTKESYKPLAISDEGKKGFFELYDKKELYYYHDEQMDRISDINVSEHYVINHDCTEILFYYWNEDAIWYFNSGMEQAKKILDHKPDRMFIANYGELFTTNYFKRYLDIDSFFPLFIRAYEDDFYYFSDLQSEPVVVGYSEIKDKDYVVNVTDKGVDIIYVYEGACFGRSDVKDDLYNLHINKDGYDKKLINEGEKEYIAEYAVTQDYSNIYVRSITLNDHKALIRKYGNDKCTDLVSADDYRDINFTYCPTTGKLYYCMDGTLYSISESDNEIIPECVNAKEISAFYNYDSFPCFKGKDGNKYTYIYGNVVRIE